MFTGKKINSPTSESEIDISIFVRELRDSLSEKICGGGANTPETTGGNSQTTPPKGNNKNIPSPAAYNELGLTPFFPDLPNNKLSHLGPLDPSTRTTPAAKNNSITITIPLPTIN